MPTSNDDEDNLELLDELAMRATNIVEAIVESAVQQITQALFIAYVTGKQSTQEGPKLGKEGFKSSGDGWKK